jgi:hypothetical protein
VRALLSYDRYIIKILPIMGLTAGVRLGFAFGGSPSSDQSPVDWNGGDTDGESPHTQASSFLPFHGEARIGVMFGDGVLGQGKVTPYGFLGGGLAQVNASVPVSVCDKRDEDGDLVVDAGEGSCPDNTRVVKDLDAYQITGLNFIGVGGGAIYGITPFLGVAAELKVMFMVPTFGIVFAPNIGPVFAF